MEKRRKKGTKEQPMVVCGKYGPYTVVDLEDLMDSRGNTLLTERVFSLCQCGESGNKTFFDGTHLDNKFDDTK